MDTTSRTPVLFPGLTQEGGGCDDIKIDPSNSSNIWLSYGGNIYKSTNRGTTFTKLTGYTVPTLNANNGSPAKAYGPYIAIDPNNSNIVYVSTPAQGVQRTLDGGSNWTTVPDTNGGFVPYAFNSPSLVVDTTSTTSNAIGTGAKSFTTASNINNYTSGVSYAKVWQTSNPANNMYGLLTGTAPNYTLTVPANSAFGSGSGITAWSFSPIVDGSHGANVAGGHCICFDISASTMSTGSGSFSGLSRTKNIYVSTYGIGVYFSSDGGQSFSLLNTTGMPKAVKRMAVTTGGVVWIADDMYTSFSNVTKYASGTWSADIHTGHAGTIWYHSLAIDPNNQSRVVFMEGNQPTVSVFDGTSWINCAGSRAKRPVVSSGDVDWLADLYTNSDGFANCDTKFDPSVANKIWTGAEGVWYFTCPTVDAASVTFTQQTRGIEEFIGNNIIVASRRQRRAGAGLDVGYPCLQDKHARHLSQPPFGRRGQHAIRPDAWVLLSITFGAIRPKVVAIIQDGGTGPRDKSGYSTNIGGVGTWTEFTAKPNSQAQGAHIAIADTNTAVWVSATTEADRAVQIFHHGRPPTTRQVRLSGTPFPFLAERHFTAESPFFATIELQQVYRVRQD